MQKKKIIITNLIQLRICLGSSCFSRGNKNFVKVVKEFIQSHNLESKIDFKGGHCFGMCHLGPVIEINGVLYEKLTEERLRELLDELLIKNEL